MDRTNFAAMIQEVIGGKGISFGRRGRRHEVEGAVEKAVKERIKEKLQDLEDEGE